MHRLPVLSYLELYLGKGTSAGQNQKSSFRSLFSAKSPLKTNLLYAYLCYWLQYHNRAVHFWNNCLQIYQYFPHISLYREFLIPLNCPKIQNFQCMYVFILNGTGKLLYLGVYYTKPTTHNNVSVSSEMYWSRPRQNKEQFIYMLT